MKAEEIPEEEVIDGKVVCITWAQIWQMPTLLNTGVLLKRES